MRYLLTISLITVIAGCAPITPQHGSNLTITDATITHADVAIRILEVANIQVPADSNLYLTVTLLVEYTGQGELQNWNQGTFEFRDSQGNGTRLKGNVSFKSIPVKAYHAAPCVNVPAVGPNAEVLIINSTGPLPSNTTTIAFDYGANGDTSTFLFPVTVN